MADLHHDSPLTLRQGFWPQTRVNVQPSEASLLENKEVSEEFDVDDHYIGPASNCPPPSFVLQWIVMKVICSFCILEMRHMQS